MVDKAQEISTWTWKWYKQAANMDKGDKEWDALLDMGNEMAKKYKDDPLNFPLFEKMFFAFSEHVARLERMDKGEI